MSDAATDLKRIAAERAVAEVRDGMALGLGTGSTAALAVTALANRIRREGLRVVGVPTSERTAAQARSLGIPVVGLDTHPELDLTIDGADAVQRGSLSLIKGLGGALLREKIVATASAEMTVIVDDSKLRGPLGTFCPVPVEISQFGWQSTARKLERLGAAVRRRADPAGTAFVTDGGNYILDCDFGEIVDAMSLEREICGLAGVLESGLFVGIASRVIIAGANGVTVLAPERAR